MENIEFYSYDDEIWCRYGDGRTELINEHNHELVEWFFNKIKEEHEEAFSILEEIYGKSKKNVLYYKFVVVKRFIKCNFSKMDTTFIDLHNEKFNFERVDCPLRGECSYEDKICMPKFDMALSSREKQIAKLWLDGMSKDDIAEETYLAWDTVNNHIRRIYRKLGVHDKAEFVKIVISKNIL